MNSLHLRASWLLGAVSATALAWPGLAQDPAGTGNPTTAPRSPLNAHAVISLVLRGNPRVGAAAEAVRAAQGARRTAGSWTNPSLSYQVENTGFPGQGSPQRLDREAFIVAMLPLEPAYQLRSRAARANAEVRAAAAELRSARRTVALQGVAAFYAAASAQVGIEALDDNRAWLDSLIRYTGARVREGAAAEVDLIRLEVERDRAEIDLALARVDLVRARATLASLIGSNEFEIDISAAADTEAFRASIPDLQLALGNAKASRPEIAASDARLAAAASGVSVERSSVVRELGLMTGVKSTAGTRSVMTGVNVALPLFDRNRGEIQRAEAERRIAEFDRQTVEREVVADVTAAFAAVQTLTAQLERMQGGLLRRAEEARRIAEAAYREGATPLTQVLEAARALAEARQLYYRTLFARAQSLIELDSTIGGGK